MTPQDLAIQSSRPRIMRRALHIVVMLLLSSPAVARGKGLEELSEGERETLETFIKAGREAFQEGRYDKALRALNEAYVVYPLPDILYRIAQCHENLGHASEAALKYRQYLDEVPDAKDREAIEARITELESVVESRVSIRTDPAGARVIVDDQFSGLSPHVFAAANPSVRLRVEIEGYEPVEQQLKLRPGVQQEFFYALKPEGAGEGTTDDGAGSGRRAAGIVALTLGGGAMIAGAGFGVVALKERSALMDVDRAQARPADYDERVQKRNRFGNFAIGSLGLGALGVGLGSWLIWSASHERAPEEQEEKPSWQAELSVSPRAAQLSVAF